MTKIHQFLIYTSGKSRSNLIFWFSLSLTFAVIYSIPGLQQAFGSEYVVQDDARQHVFWMQRFIDPGLFPNDLTADYFQSVAPVGYKAVYQVIAALGIEPFLLHKILPIALALIANTYCFFVCIELLPVPFAGFIASLLLNQSIWLQDDIISATPVAFVYPLFIAFLYYLLRHSLFGAGSSIALLGLFYPQCMLVAVGILTVRLLGYKDKKFCLSIKRKDYLLLLSGLGIATAILLSYAFKSSEFGKVISAAEAKTLPAFLPKGWSSFFSDNFSNFWLCGKRSGMIPSEWCVLTRKFFPLPIPPQIFLGLSFPILWRFSSRFPLIKLVTKEIILLPQIAIASLTMFFIAHIFVFKLHLPNRYTEHTSRILISIMAGIAITVIIDAVFEWVKVKSEHKKDKLKFLPLLFCIFLAVAILGYPHILQYKNYPFPNTRYIAGEFPSLYKFFEQQPKDIIIASLAEEANNLPSFAKRSILAGGEGYALPYHPTYYNEIRQRTVNMIEAQYSANISEVKDFINNYGVDFWLLDKKALTVEYVAKDRWLKQYQPIRDEVLAHLKKGTLPTLSKVMNSCNIFDNDNLIVLQAECIVKY